MSEIISRHDLHTLDLAGILSGETVLAPTPGDILRAEFLEPLGLSARALARDLDVPANRVTGILNGSRTITADTAIMLGDRLGTSAEFWMNLQTAYSLGVARRQREPSGHKNTGSV